MKTMKWLLRREFWEHRGALLWAPLVAGALMVILIGGMAIYAGSTGGLHDRVSIDGKVTVTSHFNAVPAELQRTIADSVAVGYMAFAIPLFLMMSIIAFFYCLGALHDERRDRSILFWKSLPISDSHAVLAKVATATVVAPLITIAVGTVVSLLLLLIVGGVLAALGLNLFGLVLSNPKLYLMPLYFLALLPVYILWALPTIGWLMMVSSWAKSKVFLWAVGAPLITMLVLAWGNYLMGARLDIDWLLQNVLGRALGGLVPGIWLPIEHVDVKQLFEQPHAAGIDGLFHTSWASLATAQAWCGAAAGAAMIAVAIRLRRWKDEG